jgi:hypothetical protein
VKKDRPITIRFQPDQFEQLKRLAAAEDGTVSWWIRRLVSRSLALPKAELTRDRSRERAGPATPDPLHGLSPGQVIRGMRPG